MTHLRHIRLALVPLPLVVLLVVLAGGLLGCRDGSGPSEGPAFVDGPRRWNVLLVSIDTLRADRLGAYNPDSKASPFLDSLAEEGVVFEHALAQASYTGPSHSSLFTSRYVSKVGKKHPRMAQLFRQAGYETVAFTGGGNLSAKFGFDRGFQNYAEYQAGFQHAAPALLDWLEHRPDPDVPFFAFLHGYDTHLPYEPPEPYDTMFFPDYSGSIRIDQTREVTRAVRGWKAEQKDLAISDDDLRYLLSLYDGEIRFVDDQLRSFFEAVPEETLERTIVVILSDHGEEFMEHGSFLHGHTLYDELLHVPLIFRLPRASLAGRRIDQQVMLLDVLPTLLEMNEIDPPKKAQGVSLLPLMSSGKTHRPRPIIAEVSKMKSVRLGDWKAIFTNTGETAELFDMANDPGETKNLAEEHPDLLEELQSAGLKRLDMNANIGFALDDKAVEDPELREQLKALGYID